MEIKSYKKKSGNLYEIELNTGEKYKIYDDIILKYELLIDKNIDKKKLEKVLKDNATQEAYYKALKYICVKMRTKKEIENYLFNKEYTIDDVVYAVGRLEREGYLDTKKYVKAYVADQITLTMNGPKKIKDTLCKLGVSFKDIDNELDKISEDVWVSKINKIIDKKARVNKTSSKMFKNKVANDLLLLGYPIEVVKPIVDNIQIDTRDAFLNEATKVYNKLSIKYEGVELELRFKNKMFSKGYPSEEISEYLSKK